MLFLFGFQGFAAALQICPEATRDNTPTESPNDAIKMETGCHETGTDISADPEACDARHCCMGAPFMHPQGPAPVNLSKARIGYLGYTCIYPRLNVIYRPPKLTRISQQRMRAGLL